MTVVLPKLPHTSLGLFAAARRQRPPCHMPRGREEARQGTPHLSRECQRPGWYCTSLSLLRDTVSGKCLLYRVLTA